VGRIRTLRSVQPKPSSACVNAETVEPRDDAGGDGFARKGGLLSYGPDQVDIYRQLLRECSYPIDLVVNRKTATALGLAIPPSILLRADEVIE
jgi:hypothetical protein